jgi:hypothetical protein
MGAREHYEALFGELESRYGPLDRATVSAIVGFSAGGPVSLSRIERKNLHVTCELSLYPEQKASVEGLKFELLSLGAFDLLTCRALFTAIGNLSMERTLGHDHTIDVRSVLVKCSASIRLCPTDDNRAPDSALEATRMRPRAPQRRR